MTKGPGKISVECPHCQAQQLESPFAKSTFCRKCGEHIDLCKRAPVPVRAKAVSAAAPEPRGAQTGLLARLTKVFKREKIREIRCRRCDAKQTISSLATSGSCAHCGTYLDLRDFKIDNTYSRSIDTHGHVIITRKGELSSPKAVCGSAVVEGKILGTLQCTGTARLKTKCRFTGTIQAYELIIEKRSEIEFVRTLRASVIEISGKTAARIQADVVHIKKGGSLHGSVHAKSIAIDKGGEFVGDLHIGEARLKRPNALPIEDDEMPSQPGLQFGDQLPLSATS